MQSTNTFELARYGADLKLRMHDMPIGDPMSGAPYGEYLKSKALGMIIGVVAAVATMGAAAPLLASTVLATQIAGGVMMAGGVLSGVGAVTGNKKLAKIGGIMSLAGGLGGLASNALSAGGSTGMFAAGSGSEAVSSMANSFMDSASSISGGLLYGDRVAGAAEAVSAGDFKGAGEIATTNPVADSQAGIVEKALGEPGTPAPAGELPVIEVKPNAVAEVKVGTGTGETNLPLDQAPSAQVPDAGGATPATDAMARGEVYGPTKPAAAEKGILAKANSFLSDNKELLKTGVGALEMGMKAGMGGDAADAATQEALSKAKVYDAQASLLTTQNSQAQFQLANQNKKSVMLSADDPNLDAKMAQAQAEGAAIGIIPSIGKGGITQNPNATFGNAANMAGTQAPSGQQVVRQATNTTATPQRVA